MKKNIAKRVLALLLAGIMLLGCACGKTEKEDENTPIENKLEGLEKVRLEHVYKSVDADIEFTNGENTYFDQLIAGPGGTVYASVFESGEDEDYRRNIMKLNADFSSMTKVASFGEEYSYDEETNASYSVYYNGFYPCADGSYWTLKYDSKSYPEGEEWLYSETVCSVHFSESGELIGEFEIDHSGTNEESSFGWVERIIPDVEGGILVCGMTKLALFSPDGKELCSAVYSYDGEYGDINLYKQLDSELIFATGIKYNETTFSANASLYRLDIGTLQLKKICDFKDEDVYDLIPAFGNFAYIRNSESLRRLDLTSGALEEEINWINSDINSMRLSVVIPIADGEFLSTEYDRNYENQRCFKMSRLADGDAVEKYVIKFAGIYLDMELRDAIIDYNKQNEEFRIEYLNYSKYMNPTDANAEGATEALNQDIISGKIPDLFLLYGLDPEVYASKGLLADIGKLMDKDEGFDRSLYLENVLEGAMYRGKLYTVFPSFNINTVVGKKSNVGSGFSWSMSDLKQLMSKYPDARVFENFTRDNMFDLFTNMSLKHYINEETGECLFGTQDFADLLGLIKQFPETIDWDAMYEEDYGYDYYTAMRENKLLLMSTMIGSFSSVVYYKERTGSDYSLIGFPTVGGNIGSTFTPTYELAMSASTKLKSACWDFLKYMLSESFQSKISYGFPMLRTALDAKATKELEDAESGGYIVYNEFAKEELALNEEIIEEDGVMEPADVFIDVETSEVEPIPVDPVDPEEYPKLTQEDVDLVKSLIGSIRTIHREDNNNKIINIIKEDAGAFFAGDKSASDVANIIQSRIRQVIGELQ